MTVFDPAVLERWALRGACPGPGQLGVLVDDTLPAARAVAVCSPVDGPAVVVLTPVHAGALGLSDGGVADASTFRASLLEAGITLNDPDHLFHLPAGLSYDGPEPGASTRRLTELDANAFGQLEATAPAADLDEAFVELDHWRVVGTFVEGRLASAASALVWTGTAVADIGVITIPSHRGRGLGARTVRALCAEIQDQGSAPQYRCQPDNVPSVALARAAGFVLFGALEIINTEE